MLASCSPQKSAEKNKVLRVNISREPTCFDPRKVYDPSHQILISMLFEGLLKLNPDLSVSFAQACAYEITSDRLVYTFHLGEHSWSDKSLVKAEDFVETYLDLLDPKFPAPHANLLYDVLNAQEAKKGLVSRDQVGIKALDGQTIQITLKRPNPCFLQIVTSPYLVPVCRKKVRENPDWALESGSDYICNGAFSLSKWTPKAEIIFKKNRNYDGKYPAKIQEVHVSLVANEMSALHMYGNGYLDIIGTPFSQIPIPYLKDLKDRKSVVINPVSASLYISFNTTAAPFNNVHLRRALALSVNRKEIIEHVTLLDEEPALSPIPSILKQRKSAQWIRDADIEEAKSELQKALETISHKELRQLTLYFWPLEINYLVAQTLQQQWRQNLELEVEIEVIDFKSLLAKVADGSYKMAIFAWSADYADPISLLHRFRYAKDASNYSRWESEPFNELLDASAIEIDSDKRLDVLEAAEKLLVDEMPIAPLFHWNFSLLVQPEVKGFAMDPLGQIRFDQISF